MATSCETPSYSRYTNGCRCEPCRQSYRDYRKDLKRRFQTGELEATHGRNYTYTNLGCRCEACRLEHNRYQGHLNTARMRAMEELRRRHLKEYRRLLARERMLGGEG